MSRCMAAAAMPGGSQFVASPVNVHACAQGSAGTALIWVKQSPTWYRMTSPRNRTLSPVPVPVSQTGWSTHLSISSHLPVTDQAVPVATMPLTPLTVRRHASQDHRLLDVPVGSAQRASSRAPPQRLSNEGLKTTQTSSADQPSGQNDAGNLQKVLDSLEVRVDLMAKMQQIRNSIQDRSKTVEDQWARDRKRHGGAASASPTRRSVYQAGAAGLQMQPSDKRHTQLPKRSGSVGAVGAEGGVESRLLGENRELWSQVRRQHHCISRLTLEVEGLRAQLERSPRTIRDRAVDDGGDATTIHSDTSENGRSSEQSIVAGTIAMTDSACTEEPLRQQLLELSPQQSPRPPRLPRSPRPLPRHSGATAAGSPGLVAPFSRQACGSNVALSEDALTATRTRGCRQSVVLGSAPLPRQQLGWYYEVEVCETVDGWVGGLGIGVTRTSPFELRRVPDKAWRLQNTWIVGYWGCVFLNGKEQRTLWRADTLPAGSRVGLLVSGDGSGDLRVFVDGVLAVSVQAAVPNQTGPESALFPVIDVFAATLKVTLRPNAVPPEPSWAVEGLSPQGSPATSLGRKVWAAGKRCS